MRLPRQGELDEATRKRHRLIIVLGLALVLIPSVWTAYRLVQQELFASGATRVARELEADAGSPVLMHEVDGSTRTLRLIVVGGEEQAQLRARAERQLAGMGLRNVQVLVRDAGDSSLNVEKLRKELQEGVNHTLVEQVKSMDMQLKALQAAEERPSASPRIDAAALRQEVQAQLPVVCAVTLAEGTRSDSASAEEQPASVVVLDLVQALSASEKESLRRWLTVRLEKTDVQLIERLDSRSTSLKEKNRRKQTTCLPKS
ncbi:hypothetical protein D3C78_1182110 [compost metagenome]